MRTSCSHTTQLLVGWCITKADVNDARSESNSQYNNDTMVIIISNPNLIEVKTYSDKDKLISFSKKHA